MKKGDTIGSFLELVRKQLEPDFRELKLLSTEKLLYVKEDLIIPHVRPVLILVLFPFLKKNKKKRGILLLIINQVGRVLFFFSLFFFLQHYSFYELIVNKARGKSGPLFYFDVHEDVRMEGDHRVEKDESHAGKVRQVLACTFWSRVRLVLYEKDF